MPLCLSKAFANFHSQELITSDPHHYVFGQHSTSNTCPMNLVLFFPLLTLFHGFLTEDVTKTNCYKKLLVATGNFQ